MLGPAMKRQPTDRRHVHLDRGGEAFIPPDRMARIRWEESVLRARLKREGVADPTITHGTCHCGSIECVGVPHADSDAGWWFSSKPDGELVVARRGVIVEAWVYVEHDPEGKFALCVTDPRGAVHRAVTAPDSQPHRWRGRRSLALPELTGAEVAGAWRLAVIDHTLGPGEHRRAWALSVALRRARRKGDAAHGDVG